VTAEAAEGHTTQNDGTLTMTFAADANVTLYAKWTLNTYEYLSYK